MQEIQKRLEKDGLPFSGVTELGSCEFRFQDPAYHAGIAMHTGSRIRKGVKEALAVRREDRFREEDPYMDAFIREFPLQVVARDSRYEYDLNREPARAVYPADSMKWGKKVWCREIPARERDLSLAKHQEFHDLTDIVVEYLLRHNRHALIFDMHSYCYQREGRISWFEDPRPEINLGTRAVNRELFTGAIESCLKELSATRIGDHPVRTAENKVFQGGYLSRRLSKARHNQVLVLALEYKKIFMDEWSGRVYPDILDVLVRDFQAAAGKIIRSEFFSS